MRLAARRAANHDGGAIAGRRDVLPARPLRDVPAAAADRQRRRWARGIRDLNAPTTMCCAVEVSEGSLPVGCPTRGASRQHARYSRSKGLRTPKAPRFMTCR